MTRLGRATQATRAALAVLAFVALAGATGCPVRESIESADDGCAQEDRATTALDPSTGRCVEFASACDVPIEWGACPLGALVACMVDEDCVPTQHCADLAPDDSQVTPPRVCVDNTRCDDAGDCGDQELCELGAAPPCDPMVTPTCPPPGLCARLPSGAPPTDGCVSNFDCAALEICPAQYGSCSPGMDPANGTACPSHCEVACLDDVPCAMGSRCNAIDVCGQGNGENPGDLLECAGWCVPR